MARFSREGYSFSESVSASVSVPELFPFFFLIFIMFTYSVWRWDPDNVTLNDTVFVGGFLRIRDNRGAELKYLSD